MAVWEYSNCFYNYIIKMHSLQVSFRLGEPWKCNEEEFGFILHTQVLSKQQGKNLKHGNSNQTLVPKIPSKKETVFMVEMGF